MGRQTITIGGRDYRRFILYPEMVSDGTCRCIRCGQIDEPDWHDTGICIQAWDHGRAGLLTPGQVDEVACRLTPAQRSVVLSLSKLPATLGCSEATAKRLMQPVSTRPALVTKREGRAGDGYALTAHGSQVQGYLIDRAVPSIRDTPNGQ